jgi:succinate dehydrogenase/fumarate reductase-like Fe-S protein
MSEDVIKTLIAERNFFESQLRKLTGIIHRQDEEINDLRYVNADLKSQLTTLHDRDKLKQEIEDIDDGRC